MFNHLYRSYVRKFFDKFKIIPKFNYMKLLTPKILLYLISSFICLSNICQGADHHVSAYEHVTIGQSPYHPATNGDIIIESTGQLDIDPGVVVVLDAGKRIQ